MILYCNCTSFSFSLEKGGERLKKERKKERKKEERIYIVTD